MRRLFKLSVVALILSSACMKEQEYAVSRDTAAPVFSATFEECVEAGSKTAMTPDRRVVWSAGDQVSIFMGNAAANQYQVDDKSAGSSTGNFEYAGSDADWKDGSSPACNIAYYPYAQQLAVQEGDGCCEISGIILPQEQTYVEGSFGQGTFPMVAMTDALDDYDLNFRNVCGAIRIRMTGSNTVKSLRITGKNNERLSGNATLNVSRDKDPELVMSEDAAGSAVTLSCPGGVALDPVTPTDFFIVLPPVVFTKGFIVEATYAGGAVHRFETDKSNTVFRSKILSMPPVELPYMDDDKAYLLNLDFNADGTVTDRSMLNHNVQTFASARMFNYYNEGLEDYACHFGSVPGLTITSGYHKIDYKNNAAMKTGLGDGFSAEVLFKCNELPQYTAYSSLLSSIQGPGFGICLLNTTHEIRFEIQTDGESAKKKLHTGIVPEPGKYYHVVAVWDGTTAKVYVNGELAVEDSAKGNLTLPASEFQWIGVGADSDGAKAATPFNGDIAVAKIHDAVLSAEEVTSLYTPVSDAPVISQNLYYRNECTLAPGCSYYIYNSGELAGNETVILTDGTKTTQCSWSSVSDGVQKVTIPSGLTGSECALHIKRGDSYRTLGLMNVGTTPYAKVPGVFAHRCKGSGSYQENTVAGLTATQGREKDGITGAEFDVWITSDGEVVVYHNSSFTYGYVALGWTTTLVLEESKYSDLKSGFKSESMTLNTLDEFFTQGLKAPNVILNFEIKEHSTDERNIACAEAVAAKLKAHDIVSQCRVMSYSEVALKRLQELVPDLKIDFLDKTPDVAYTVTAGYEGISTNQEYITPILVKNAHNAGLEITGFTPSTEAEVMNLINQNVDYITVNLVDMALGVVTRPYVE